MNLQLSAILFRAPWNPLYVRCHIMSLLGVVPSSPHVSAPRNWGPEKNADSIACYSWTYILTRHSKSNPIELNRTQSVDWVRLSSAIERNRTHRKEKKSIEPNRTFDFRTRDLCKTDVENPLPDLRSSSYFSPECSARVFRKRRNSAEMASDALWIVSFKCIVKGYQECRFDVKDGEVFRVCSVLFS